MKIEKIYISLCLRRRTKVEAYGKGFKRKYQRKNASCVGSELR